MKNTFMPNKTTFAEQINLAQHQAMQDDHSMIAMGLGINDPKAIFDTTSGLVDEFGADRVFDMPTSENAMTGVGIGAAISGSRVLMTHQRVDFFLLAMDQLVNNAAKWHYMFNGKMSVPLTIRLIIGRGWGQGPTHQQNLQSWFAHIPGLQVIVPSTTDNVGQLLYSALMNNNPTIFLEHRWLHNQQCEIDNCLPFNEKPLNIRQHQEGSHFTLVANSYMLIEALTAAKKLAENGIYCDVLEIIEPSVHDFSAIYESVNTTGHCLICDISHEQYSISSEISSKITEECFTNLKSAPKRLGLPHYPEPTSFSLTKNYYKSANNIIEHITKVLNFKDNLTIKNNNQFHDVPGDWFRGPF